MAWNPVDNKELPKNEVKFKTEANGIFHNTHERQVPEPVFVSPKTSITESPFYRIHLTKKIDFGFLIIIGLFLLFLIWPSALTLFTYLTMKDKKHGLKFMLCCVLSWLCTAILCWLAILNGLAFLIPAVLCYAVCYIALLKQINLLSDNG
jgi:hypothetical protein